MADQRYDRVIKAIDAYNRQDPTQVMDQGQMRPHELVYAERLSRWVERCLPMGSDELRIAARGQHIGRWTIPRNRYPMDRGGYLRWREELKRFHSDTVVSLMKESGFRPDQMERVRSLILKKNLQVDAEAQALEDALCLLFLETQFDDLRGKTPDPKMKEIVRKTWKKMSPAAHEMALQLPLEPAQRSFIQAALTETQ